MYYISQKCTEISIIHWQKCAVCKIWNLSLTTNWINIVSNKVTGELGKKIVTFGILIAQVATTNIADCFKVDC